MNWLAKGTRTAQWAGRIASAAGFLLWFVYSLLWAHLDGHNPHAPVPGHAFEYPGHAGPFYLRLSDFILLNAVMVLAITLFVGGGWVARRVAPRNPPWRLP